MLCFKDQISPDSDASGIIDQKYLTVQKAEELTGYNSQYLRRLLREGKLNGIKIGQVWLVLFDSLSCHFSQAVNASDRRFGPKAAQTAIRIHL